MVYGGFGKKVAFIRPVIERVHFVHGQIGNPGCMQVEIGDLETTAMLPFVGHFRTLWTRVFEAFLPRSLPGERFCFTAELLASNIY